VQRRPAPARRFEAELRGRRHLSDTARKDDRRDDLPEVDIIFSRDCLVHLSSLDIFGAIRDIKRSGSRYLLTSVHSDCAENREILTGEWRPLDLQKAPFHFPSPVKLIDEKCAELGGRYADKFLGLWKIADLPG
jgi:hypothetical protein